MENRRKSQQNKDKTDRRRSSTERRRSSNDRRRSSTDNRRSSQYGEEEEDTDEVELPSHHCLIVDRSFEALKRAGSSTVEMHNYNTDIHQRVNYELNIGSEFDSEISEGKKFLHRAENDSVLAMIREREEEGASDDGERVENHEICGHGTDRLPSSSKHIQSSSTRQDSQSSNENTEQNSSEKVENVDSSTAKLKE